MHNNRARQTKKRIHKQTIRAHKHNFKRTRHNKRHNITHKSGGSWGLNLFNKTSSEPTQTPTENAKMYSSLSDNAKLQRDKLAVAETSLAGASLATNVARVAVVGLSLTGVGLPLAGAIATALVIAHVFAEMNISNLNLKTVMYDTLNIISNSYILNDYIAFIEEHMNKYASDEIKNSINKNEIIQSLKERLKDKIVNLIGYLLSIATNEMLQSLEHDKSATPAIIGLINEEKQKRRGFSVTNLASRVAARTIKADRTSGYIIRDLSIINGYFMLVKSHFDLSLDVFERSLSSDDAKKFWDDIKTSPDTTNNGSTVEYQYKNVNGIANNPFTRYLHGTLDIKNVEKDANAADQNAITGAVNKSASNEDPPSPINSISSP